MSFQQICVQESVSFQELLRVARHLEFWGLGLIIHPIKAQSVYKLTSKILDVSEPVKAKFKADFGHDLSEWLQQMFASGPTPLFRVRERAKRPMREI
jgi:hypothetical protein